MPDDFGTLKWYAVLIICLTLGMGAMGKKWKIWTQTGPQAFWFLSSILNTRTYNIPDRMSFDWVFSGQWKTTQYDEDEDDVGEVMMMNEVVAGNSETKWTLARLILRWRSEKW